MMQLNEKCSEIEPVEAIQEKEEEVISTNEDSVDRIEMGETHMENLMDESLSKMRL
jgi:hypothetical protein